MKKAELKESIIERAISKGYTKEQVEAALNRLKEKKGKDLDGDGDIDSDDYMAAKDKAIKANMAEGRRKKTQGGKIVTENDYETGGYVESMGPMFDKAVSGLVAAFIDWKEGPMTEPGMIPHAKKDVVTYIDNQLEQSLTEDHSDNPNDKYVVRPCKNKKEPWAVWEGETRVKGFATKEEAKAFADNKNKEQGLNEAQLKEAFKGIIANILKEEVITEAATGNLSKIADTYNDFEGMQSAVNALENIVTDVESYYAKTKEKIQKIYDSFNNIKNPEGIVMGTLIGPSIQNAFKKDLMPVASKGFTGGLKLPQVKILKPGDVQEEELEEKATIFTPISETRKRKYTKSKK